jgi:biopolymer transport protein ExbB/TolQ
MLSQSKLRMASGIGLIVAVFCVMAQSVLGHGEGNQLYFGAALVAVFAYLFLSSRSEEESDLPWWW